MRSTVRRQVREHLAVARRPRGAAELQVLGAMRGPVVIDAVADGHMGAELSVALVVSKHVWDCLDDEAALCLKVAPPQVAGVANFNHATLRNDQLARQIRSCAEAVRQQSRSICVRAPGLPGIAGNELEDLAATLSMWGEVSVRKVAIR